MQCEQTFVNMGDTIELRGYDNMNDEEIYTFIINLNAEQLKKLRSLLNDDFTELKEIIKNKLDSLTRT